MKLTAIKLENFRSYLGETIISLSDFTTLIGKNDAGKSTILEALEIFFNSEIVKPDPDDVCKFSGGNSFAITGLFDDLPSQIVIDDSVDTTFGGEYLLNRQGELEVRKVYTCLTSSVKTNVFLNTFVPFIPRFTELVTLNNNALKTFAKELSINEQLYNKTSNVSLRQAIRTSLLDSHHDIESIDYLLEISGTNKNLKEIYTKIQKSLPHYALFQADRPSRDDDNEVQNPLKLAIKNAIDQVSVQLEAIKNKVQNEVMEVANHTLQKLAEMDPALAQDLIPQPKKEPEWHKIFNFTLDGDNDIPINKRGSGVRRLVLLNFFRAQAERTSQERNIILAVEEPETAQHPNNQRKLVETLISLSENQNYQVLITTHVPAIAEIVPLESLRYITDESKTTRNVSTPTSDIYLQIADQLGILPDKRVRLFLCVEGKNDVAFLKNLSRVLHSAGETSIHLGQDSRVVIFPVGGCASLKQFVFEHYLKEFDLPYVYILDSDNKDSSNRDFQGIRKKIATLNNGSELFITTRREMENYLCPNLIKEHIYKKYRFPEDLSFPLSIEHDTDVPKALHLFLQEHSHLLGNAAPPNEDTIKGWLNNAVVSKITVSRLQELSVYDELREWFAKMEELCVRIPQTNK